MIYINEPESLKWVHITNKVHFISDVNINWCEYNSYCRWEACAWSCEPLHYNVVSFLYTYITLLYFNVVNAAHFNFPQQLQSKQHHPIYLDLFLTFEKKLKVLLHFLIKNKKPTKNESHRQEETLIKYCESQKVILQFKDN